MTERIKKFITKYRHFVLYVLVGCVTTLVNYAIFYFPGMSHTHWLARNTAAWAGSVIFSFFANRRFVFESSAASTRKKVTEFFGFVISRLFSLVAEDVVLGIAATMGISDSAAKIPTSIFVMALNYVTGHLVFNGCGAVIGSVKRILRIEKKDIDRIGE